MFQIFQRMEQKIDGYMLGVLKAVGSSYNSSVTKGHTLCLTMMIRIRGNQGSEGAPTDPIGHKGPIFRVQLQHQKKNEDKKFRRS
jgi:hypothetical protein